MISGNVIAHGDNEAVLAGFPKESVDLIITSPPYFNARPEYSVYDDYQTYLNKIAGVIRSCHRVLGEGRFFVMNISPVLIKRVKRSESSQRIAIPFDVHQLFVSNGFDFIEDIIWQKPDGAGWQIKRGMRFFVDRTPLQYKTVPVTEYILVYRKRTDRLIDWNIRKHHDQDAVKESRIDDDYERTNVWKLHPAHDKRHPAIFPDELVERVVRYYSFMGDVVLDPFAGIGTVGRIASSLRRKFVLIDKELKYAKIMVRDSKSWADSDLTIVRKED